MRKNTATAVSVAKLIRVIGRIGPAWGNASATLPASSNAPASPTLVPATRIQRAAASLSRRQMSNPQLSAGRPMTQTTGDNHRSVSIHAPVLNASRPKESRAANVATPSEMKSAFASRWPIVFHGAACTSITARLPM